MKFSIIVPVYNVEDYLENAIKSILVQDGFDECEIILVNDGSTDTSLNICNKYSSLYNNISLITKNNGGLSSARNVGIKSAIGEYLIFFDSDDLLPINTLKSYSDLIMKNSFPDIIVGKIERFYHNGNKEKDEFEYINTTLNGTHAIDYIFNSFHTPMWSACRSIFRREFFLKTGRFFKEKITSEDFELIPKLMIKAESIAFNNNITYSYRVGRNDSISNTVSIRRFNDIYSIVKDYLVFFECLENEKIFDIFKKQLGNVIVMYLFYSIYLNDEDRIVIINKFEQLNFLIKFSNTKKGLILRQTSRFFSNNVSLLMYKKIKFLLKDV
ncbi:glycosyltransferase family 2 protein [Photobacterium damselae]